MKYVEFHKKDVEEVLKKLEEKKYTNFLKREFNGQEYYAFTHKLIFAKNNLKYFEPYMVQNTNKCFICGAYARFNYKNYGYGRYCSEHRLDNMCDFYRAICIKKNCLIRANFGGIKTKPLYCKKHSNGAKDVVSNICTFEGCEVFATFGYTWQKPIRCKSHIEENMIDVKHKRCNFENCITRCCFGYEWLKPIRCVKHKEENMEDVVSEKCTFKNCNSRAYYGFENNKAIRCGDHIENKMINLKNQICNFSECKKQATFGFDKGLGIRCKNHKTEEMIDVKHELCLTHLCSIRPSKKYEGYCLRCFIYMFPTKPHSLNYKTKEFAVVEFIKNKFSDLNWVCDKKSGNSGRRPDLLCNLQDQVIIIEVDENAHNSEEYRNCENKRIMEISQDLNHKPIIFIRFNPDKYKDINGEKIESCWKINGNSICVISNNYLWEARLNVLAYTVNYWIKNKTEKTIEQIFLYYNGF